jgi:hypothetical protein
VHVVKALPTWIVLERDVSDSITIRGQRSTHLAVVLDTDSGLMVNTTAGTAAGDVVRRALKSALTRPAEPLVKAIPERLVCPPSLIDLVRTAASTLSRLVDTTIVEGVEMWDSEEVFDSLVGHMEGRSQPEDPPAVGDWKFLYGALADYVAAEPWHRWSDSDYFHTTLELDGDTIERFSIVLGAAGIQRGFNVVTDPKALEDAADAGGNPLEHLEQSLIVHLDPWRETHGVLADKARRYGWPDDARLVPKILTVRGGEPADLSRTDARLLALAVRAVLDQNAKRLTVAGAAAIQGELRFEDGVVGRFEVARP